MGDLPSPGIFFRIVNAKSKAALQAREGGTWLASDDDDEDTDSMYWELEKSTWGHRIKSREMGTYITARKEQPIRDMIGNLFCDDVQVVRLASYSLDTQEQMWFISASKYKDTYQIKESKYYNSLYADAGDEHLHIDGLNKDHKENCWEFVYEEDMEVINIEFSRYFCFVHPKSKLRF